MEKLGKFDPNLSDISNFSGRNGRKKSNVKDGRKWQADDDTKVKGKQANFYGKIKKANEPQKLEGRNKENKSNKKDLVQTNWFMEPKFLDRMPDPISLSIIPRGNLDLLHVGHDKARRFITHSGANLTHTRELAASQGLSPPSILLGSGSVESDELLDAIADHGERRIQTLYFQLLAYWGEGCDIDRSITKDQHGIAEQVGWSAAHSTLLPSLKDTHLSQLRP